jgi:hypothetical protein
MIDPRIEATTPFTETELNKIEQVLRRPLPKDYRDFAIAYGGAFVGGLIDDNPELPILTFLSADATLEKLEMHSDLRSDGILPVADCELGNLYVLDRENAVHYINYYGGSTSAINVTDRFSEFLARIVVCDN